MLFARLLEEPDVRAPEDPRFIGSGLYEALFAFLILLPILFVVQLGSKGPALSFGLTMLYAALRGGRLAPDLARRWPLLLVPAYALLSMTWSDYPGVTAKHALELCLTVLGGLLFASSPAPAGALAGAWGAFGLFMLVSLVLGKQTDVGSVATGMTEGAAFAGLNGVKNLFGMTASIAALTSLFMLTRSALRRGWLVFLAAAGLLVIELYLAYVARSAGALVAVVLSCGAFAVTASLAPLRPGGRVVACVLLVILATAGGVLLYAFADSLTATTLNIFHKDPTLTGRSYLWYRAGDFIRERPLLGRGFEGFWVQGNIDAEGLWQWGGMTGRSGFNFHNTLIELLIHFGVVGTAITLAAFLAAFLGLFRRVILRPNAIAAFYVAFVVFQLARTPFESLMPASVDFATVLMFAALGYGFGKLKPATLGVEEQMAMAAMPLQAAPYFARQAFAPRRPLA